MDTVKTIIHGHELEVPAHLMPAEPVKAAHTSTPYEAKQIYGWGNSYCIATIDGTRPIAILVRDSKFYTEFVKTPDGGVILSDVRAEKAGNYVATPEIKKEILAREKATAEFIVTACNAHDALLIALRDAVDALRIHAPDAWALKQAEAALAKAGVSA